MIDFYFVAERFPIYLGRQEVGYLPSYGMRVDHFRKCTTNFAVRSCRPTLILPQHYLRLYIYAFAFQAHVQRATDASEETDIAVPSSTMFPRGPMGSPDAKFILEAIDAAADLLRICTDRLHPQGVLQFLPWRYFLYFAYAGVFLLKAVFIKAVAPLVC